MASREERPPKDRVQVTPDPSRPKLFEFLESHFGKEAMPNWVRIHQAYGPGGRKYAQTALFQKEFKPTQALPTREQLVALSNQLSDMAQQNCNELSKSHGYTILLSNYGNADKPYAGFYFKCAPLLDPNYDPNEVDEDENGITTDAKRRDSLLEYGLSHLKVGDENHRWQQDQFSQAMGDILQKYQDLATQLMTQNLEMQREHRELFKVADEALSKKADRDLAAEMQKFKIGMLQDGANYLKKIIPVVVQQMKGKDAEPGQPSPESLGVQEFLNDLTDKQAEQLFGKVDTTGEVAVPAYDGVFSREQVEIFFGVANLRIGPSALDLLLDGEHAVTQEQMMRAMNIVSMQQIQPLSALLMTRKKKQVEARVVS